MMVLYVKVTPQSPKIGKRQYIVDRYNHFNMEAHSFGQGGHGQNVETLNIHTSMFFRLIEIDYRTVLCVLLIDEEQCETIKALFVPNDWDFDFERAMCRYEIENIKNTTTETDNSPPTPPCKPLAEVP